MLYDTFYALFDAAKMGDAIGDAKQMNKNFTSLYRGDSEEKLKDVAPYLFLIKNDKPFTQWYLQNGWGKSWGVLIKSMLNVDELRKHFRKFLFVDTEQGQQIYFRFYDPRVLSVFLPTCDKQQLADFFAKVDCFIAEDTNSAFGWKYTFDGWELRAVKIKLSVLTD